jgi:TRAP-type C4-dicarboxylate transport system substrate-binding protein
MLNRKRPIYVPKDLAGLKFRVWESPSARLSFELMGMNPTPMAYGEVFTAVQQGVVDGLVNSMTTLYQTKMHEVAKYLSVSDQICAFLFLLISENVFNAMTSEEQAAVREAAHEACTYWRGIYPQNDATYRALLDKEGCEVNDVDKVAFTTHVRQNYGRYAEIVREPGIEDLIARMIAFAEANS